jgi:hypothetical protein
LHAVDFPYALYDASKHAPILSDLAPLGLIACLQNT